MDGCRRQRSPGDPRATVSPWKSAPCGTTRWPLRTASPKRSANRSGGGRSSWTPCGPSFSSGIGSRTSGATTSRTCGATAAWKRACAPTSFSPFRFPIRFWTRRGMPACFPACGGACLRRTACGRWHRARPVIVLCMKAAPPNAMRPGHQGTVWPWLLGGVRGSRIAGGMGRARLGAGAAADHTALVRPAPRRRGDRVRFGNV